MEETNDSARGFVWDDDIPAVFQSIYQAVMGDETAEAQSFAQLREGIRAPNRRHTWSKLVVKHPTEWEVDGSDGDVEAGMDRAIEDEDRNGENFKQYNKDYLEKLIFWNDLSEPTANNVHHFHPVAFVDNVIRAKTINVTVEMLQRVFTGVTDNHVRYPLLEFMARDISENAEFYQLDTPLRLSHFFAQVREEIGSTCSTVENLNYSVEGLSIFSYFRNNPVEADLYGYKKDSRGNYTQRANQEAIANRAYGGRPELRNGDVASGDGWRYRGRGLKHLTGRFNYTQFNAYHRRTWGGTVDFINNPELVADEYLYVVRSGVYFWSGNNLPNLADLGSEGSHVNAITRIVNLHTDSYAARRGNFNRIYHNEQVFEDI